MSTFFNVIMLKDNVLPQGLKKSRKYIIMHGRAFHQALNMLEVREENYAFA